MFKVLQQLFRRAPTHHIKVDEFAFQVSASNGERFFIRYDLISSVTAYKRDLLSEDVICFSVSYLDHGSAEIRTIEVNEDMQGFEGLDAKFSKTLDGYDGEWRVKVVKPAFAENRTQVYKNPQLAKSERSPRRADR